MRLIKKRPFSLLEVLIALTLISVSIPILINPYLFEVLNLNESERIMRQERTLSTLKAVLFEALHTGKIAVKEEDQNKWQEIDPTWTSLKGKFTLTLNRKKEDEAKRVELWNLTIALEGSKDNPQTYLFVRVGK